MPVWGLTKSKEWFTNIYQICSLLLSKNVRPAVHRCTHCWSWSLDLSKNVPLQVERVELYFRHSFSSCNERYTYLTSFSWHCYIGQTIFKLVKAYGIKKNYVTGFASGASNGRISSVYILLLIFLNLCKILRFK